MSDFVVDTRRAIEERLTALQREVGQLEKAAAALAGASSVHRKPARGRGAAAPRARAAQTRRRRRRPSRAAQVERLVRQNPGITSGELAKRLRVQPQALYNVVSQLRKANKVRKEGRGLHPA